MIYHFFISSSTLPSSKCDQGTVWFKRSAVQSGRRALFTGWAGKHKAQDPESRRSDQCRSLSCFSSCFSFQIIHRIRTPPPITVQPLEQSPWITWKKLTICLISSHCKEPQKEAWRGRTKIWIKAGPALRSRKSRRITVLVVRALQTQCKIVAKKK